MPAERTTASRWRRRIGPTRASQAITSRSKPPINRSCRPPGASRKSEREAMGKNAAAGSAGPGNRGAGESGEMGIAVGVQPDRNPRSGSTDNAGKRSRNDHVDSSQFLSPASADLTVLEDVNGPKTAGSNGRTALGPA